MLQNLHLIKALGKQASNNIYISARMPFLLCYEGTNREDTVATEADVSIWYKELPRKSTLLWDTQSRCRFYE